MERLLYKALIVGASGQDGHHLAQLLLQKGYSVCGTSRTPHAKDDIDWFHLPVMDQNAASALIQAVKPDEIYNLAAQSSVSESWDKPVETAAVTAMAPLYLLEAIRQYHRSAKFFQASSAAVFGNAKPICNEQTQFAPCSPYGVSKLFAQLMTTTYRTSHGLFAASGILYNHESELRPESFVTRKISRAVARIKLGKQESLILGNLDASRDWGYAGDYVEAMWLMLQSPKPVDYIIATGKTHTVREFVNVAFSHVGLCWADYVTVDHQLFRPVEQTTLCGDASKLWSELGWRPKTSFKQLVAAMVDRDLVNER